MGHKRPVGRFFSPRPLVHRAGPVLRSKPNRACADDPLEGLPLCKDDSLHDRNAQIAAIPGGMANSQVELNLTPSHGRARTPTERAPMQSAHTMLSLSDPLPIIRNAHPILLDPAVTPNPVRVRQRAWRRSDCQCTLVSNPKSSQICLEPGSTWWRHGDRDFELREG
jgi:hypothetical protein